jgi:hypothetical protein
MAVKNRTTPLLTGCVLAVVLALSSTASAQNVTGAANAYARAQKAELSGDFDTAAELYELADSLAPAPQALRSALKARKAAGQLRSAALHAEELLTRYPNDSRSKDLAEETLKLAAGSLSRFEIECRPTACAIAIDGTATASETKQQHVLYVDAGRHEVVATFGEAKAAPQTIDAAAGFKGSLTFDAPPQPPPPVNAVEAPAAPAPVDATADSGVAPSKGLSPWYFAASAVVTVGFGAATLWSGLDTLSAHDDYKKHETESGYQNGLDKERRTNILIGGTAIFGVATGVLAIFTQWNGSSNRSAVGGVATHASMNVTPGGGFVSLSGTY